MSHKQTRKEGGGMRQLRLGFHRQNRSTLVLVGRLIGISLDDANSFRRDALPFFCSFILVAAPVQLKTTQHQCARASASSLQQMRCARRPA